MTESCCHQQTIATMILCYGAYKSTFEYNFGYAYPEEAARYMFTSGNYNCDCNLSRFMGIKQMDCGHKIEIRNLTIEVV